ncbi:hypothetical protein ONZ45_g10951 [Pleurotus djamor]|nr:hypothetical protein ONZ45_g10951 [Pleurotus djamor]
MLSLLFLAINLPGLVAGRERTHFDWNQIKHVYAFGDSYTFVQGTLGHANFSFIGDALSPTFTPEQLLSNEIVPRNLEFLTGCFQGRPADCAIQLWDFAFAGADIDAALLPRHHDFTVALVEQVEQWATFTSHVLPKPPASTLTAWWIGINDTGDTLSNSTITDFSAFWEKEMQSYFMAVNKAFDNGLTGAHLFINVPPEERSPSSLGNPAKALLQKDHILLFNSILSTHTDAFESAHPSTTVLRFDAHAWFNHVLDNASEFGFTNTSNFCTCTLPEFFWFDSGHPTEHVHAILADAIREELLHASRQS